MSYMLYKISFEPVVELTEEEVNAIEKIAHPVEDSEELTMQWDFDPECSSPEIAQLIEDFKRQVKPETFDVIKGIAYDGNSFTIV